MILPGREGVGALNEDFASLIKNDRESRRSQFFEGSFLEYLNLVKSQPELVMLAHERLYRLINEPGVQTIKCEDDPRLKRIYGNESIRKYRFF
jgi:Putative Ser protein kinase